MPHFVLKVSKTGKILKKVYWCPSKQVATAICRGQFMVFGGNGLRFEAVPAP